MSAGRRGPVPAGSVCDEGTSIQRSHSVPGLSGRAPCVVSRRAFCPQLHEGGRPESRGVAKVRRGNEHFVGFTGRPDLLRSGEGDSCSTSVRLEPLVCTPPRPTDTSVGAALLSAVAPRAHEATGGRCLETRARERQCLESRWGNSGRRCRGPATLGSCPQRGLVTPTLLGDRFSSRHCPHLTCFSLMLWM